jgi:hypothetical protein
MHSAAASVHPQRMPNGTAARDNRKHERCCTTLQTVHSWVRHKNWNTATPVHSAMAIDFFPFQAGFRSTQVLLIGSYVIVCYDKIDINESVEITKKMQPCNRNYYTKDYWRLNMFRAGYHSSSGALNCICSLWFIYTCGDRPLSRLCGKCSYRVIIIWCCVSSE